MFGIRNLILNNEISQINRELIARNTYIELMCKQHNLDIEEFYFDTNKRLPQTTAYVVGKGYQKRFIVITTEIHPSIKI
jgi:GR25 family glycosyltransferase involved in LPS biosynthesis